MGNRFSKPVAFNKTNENDKRILKHVSRRNFSGYVKKLIMEDINRREEEKGNTGQNKANEGDRLDRLKQKQRQDQPAPPKKLF